MKTTASLLALLGCISFLPESANGQLFRRSAQRSRRCCCTPAMQVVTHPASPLPYSSAQVHSATPTANSPTTIPALKLTPATPMAPAQLIPAAPIVSPSDRVGTGEIVGAKAIEEKAATKGAKEWKSLFDGKALGDWVSTRFGGEGEVAVRDGRIECDFGNYITGVTYKGKDLPTNNYEIELEAMRVDGGDFFCGLTFPVDDSHATFVVGGWGGSVTGISSIDDYDASENDTTDYMQFENKKWYKIRVRVTKGVLEAWINDKKMVSKDVDASRLSTRIEVDPSKPLGIASFNTQSAYRNIRIRSESNPDTKTKN